MLVINNFGIFFFVCIDFDVWNFVINIILILFFINDLEGLDFIFFNFLVDGFDFLVFENLFVNVGVFVLCEMVKVWWVEVC